MRSESSRGNRGWVETQPPFWVSAAVSHSRAVTQTAISAKSARQLTLSPAPETSRQVPPGSARKKWASGKSQQDRSSGGDVRRCRWFSTFTHVCKPFLKPHGPKPALPPASLCIPLSWFQSPLLLPLLLITVVCKDCGRMSWVCAGSPFFVSRETLGNLLNFPDLQFVPRFV